jgi:hypothetical protein
VIRKYPFTEAAVTQQRQTETAVTPGSRPKNERYAGGRAKQVLALPIDFVSHAL